MILLQAFGIGKMQSLSLRVLGFRATEAPLLGASWKQSERQAISATLCRIKNCPSAYSASGTNIQAKTFTSNPHSPSLQPAFN